ncbi:MAG: SDR family oxidoreductase [Anaerolineales bacterium]|nr:SDR family oxidoreductase [Anaerolineales bacterium]
MTTLTSPTTPPILVTGASTGIGHHLTCYFAERGYPVYATARKPQDLEALAEIENVTPIAMDVRNPDQIQHALEQITEHGQGLYGLVNNAGIGELGLLATWTDEEMFNIFDINVLGPHRMTNAFVRLLIEAQGRIVNIGSQGGMITSKYYGPYTMTKHALEAYTQALHLELEPYGVWVSIVQPGGIVTNAGQNSSAGTVAKFQRATPPFQAEADQILASFNQPSTPQPDEPESATNRKPSSPEIVSMAVYDALFSPRPKIRYLVGTHWEGNRVIHALLDKLLDENDNPMHNYSRDQLIALLDEHLAQRNTA